MSKAPADPIEPLIAQLLKEPGEEPGREVPSLGEGPGGHLGPFVQHGVPQLHEPPKPPPEGRAFGVALEEGLRRSRAELGPQGVVLGGPQALQKLLHEED